MEQNLQEKIEQAREEKFVNEGGYSEKLFKRRLAQRS